MLQLSREERLIKLKGATNVRDLGGYETQQGYYTKTHRFVRSASTTHVTDEDKKILYDYGIRHVIDLRSDYELVHQPDIFKESDNIIYHNINLIQSKTANVVPDDIMNYKDLSGFYIYIIEVHKEKMKEVFDLFAKYLYDGILFHCSAGKDRTGIIAALLMDLVGCHEYDIVKDYSESYENNLAIMQELEEMVEPEQRAMLGSNPNYMIRFLDYLRDHYGSAKEYLLSCGVDATAIEEIIESFII